MLDIFNNHKKIILRLFGSLILLVGFALHFWDNTNDVISHDELAAMNVARMEASVAGKSSGKSTQPPSLMKEYLQTRQKHFTYLTILVMILGAGFLGYSFIKKEK
jgi:hypothetical protein